VGQNHSVGSVGPDTLVVEFVQHLQLAGRSWMDFESAPLKLAAMTNHTTHTYQSASKFHLPPYHIILPHVRTWTLFTHAHVRIYVK